MNLLLTGPIGCGKSTMIRNALGRDAGKAGGYVTLRVLQEDQLMGFDLAPAACLADPDALKEARRFLEFQDRPIRHPEVFEELGSELLLKGCSAPYAVADEFGGVELLIPQFKEALLQLLRSPVPCIGVVKSQEASRELARRLGLGNAYLKAYEELMTFLRKDPETRILPTVGRFDSSAHEEVDQWVRTYVRK